MVAGHIVVDTIISDRFSKICTGGPPCYSGLTARSFGYKVTAATKIGYDFREEDMLWLARNQLEVTPDSRSQIKPTTKFKIVQKSGSTRELYLLARCEDLEISQLNSLSADAVIVNSVAGEVPHDFLKKSSRMFPFIYLDPQGHLREFSEDGRCTLMSKFDLRLLQYVDVVKVGEEELPTLTGEVERLNGIKRLRKNGVKHIVVTASKGKVLLCTNDQLCDVPIPSAHPVDTTGVGDIFGGAFVASYLKDRDMVWSACMGVAASHLSLEHIGISKIPRCQSVEEEATRIQRGVSKLVSI